MKFMGQLCLFKCAPSLTDGGEKTQFCKGNTAIIDHLSISQGKLDFPEETTPKSSVGQNKKGLFIDLMCTHKRSAGGLGSSLALRESRAWIFQENESCGKSCFSLEVIHVTSAYPLCQSQSHGPTQQPTRLICPWSSPGKNTGVGSHSLLLRIFPTQGLTLNLLHCRWIVYHPSPQESPNTTSRKFSSIRCPEGVKWRQLETSLNGLHSLIDQQSFCFNRLYFFEEFQFHVRIKKRKGCRSPLYSPPLYLHSFPHIYVCSPTRVVHLL